MSKPDTTSIKTYFLQLQQTICQALEKIDGKASFVQDRWQRPEGGSGCSSVLQEGAIIEKCGVNFSHVWGKSMPLAATKQRPELSNCAFVAMGVSVIIHPLNPYAPTTHLNVRFFNAQKPDGKNVWWFGGGFDLTPFYGFEEDCIHWHQTARRACEAFGREVYPRYKQEADDYFYLKHRQEPRGIGGIFFDDLNQWDFKTCFAFVQSIGDHFLPAYLPILDKRSIQPYTEKQRQFQCMRRGRYVEFNLIYDRGTLFGLQSGGRTESILISLPPQVQWRYGWHPEPGSEEARLYEFFLLPRNWADFEMALLHKPEFGVYL